MVKVGRFEVYHFVENRFHLDGGTMFGVVPRMMWQKLIAPDEKNLIPMDNNLYVVRANGKNILLDTGLGDALTEQDRKVYNCWTPSNMLPGLKSIGFTPDDIDFVFFSHLHTDHLGGAVRLENGRKAPVFRKARHFIQKKEWEDAQKPDERTDAVYLPDDLAALEEAKLVELIEGEAQLLPGLTLRLTGGHTPGHQGCIISDGGSTLVYYADIFPSRFHIRTAYVAGVDLFPRETMKVKRELVPKVASEGTLIAFDHDLQVKVGRLEEKDGRLVAVPVSLN